MPKHTLAFATLMLFAAPIAAQTQRAVHVVSFPGTVSMLHYNEDGLVWAAAIQNDNKTLVGGSVVAQASSVLKTKNSLRPILRDEKTGESYTVFCAEEALGNNQFRYWGLDIAGQWQKSVTLSVGQNARPTLNFEGEHIASVIGGNSMIVFNMWLGQWVSFPLLGSNAVLTNGVNVMCMKSGTSLVAYSAFGQGVKILRSVASDAKFMPGAAPNASTCLCYKVGEKEVAFFSGLLETWTRVKLNNKVDTQGTFIEYGEHCCALQDGNTLYMFSSTTGKLSAHTFADLNTVLGRNYVIDDLTCVFLDMKATPAMGHIYSSRASKFDSVKISSAAKIHVDAEWGMIEDGTKFHYVSGARVGASLKTLDLGSERIVTDKLGARIGLVTDDATFMIVTDKAVYGYVAPLNLVSRRAVSNIPLKWSGQDWFGYYQMSDAIHAMSIRDGKWYTLKLKVTAGDVEDQDGVVIVKDKANQKNWYFGGESTGWQSMTANTAGEIDQFILETGGFVATAVKGGGTDLGVFSAVPDEVVTHRYPVTLKKEAFLPTVEALYVLDTANKKLIVLSASSDITPQEGWPLAFRSTKVQSGFSVRWLLRGPPSHVWWMNFALYRGSMTIPGIRGTLRLDPSTLFVNLLSGQFDGRGITRFNTLVPAGVAGHAQMLTFKQTGSTVVNAALSQAYSFMIH